MWVAAYLPEAGHERFGLPKADRAAGRSAWQALYRQVGEVFVVAAVGPEAQSDPRGFDRAVRRAQRRLADLEEG
jgi:hypothetical protein